jgi:hypothetical protein
MDADAELTVDCIQPDYGGTNLSRKEARERCLARERKSAQPIERRSIGR